MMANVYLPRFTINWAYFIDAARGFAQTWIACSKLVVLCGLSWT